MDKVYIIRPRQWRVFEHAFLTAAEANAARRALLTLADDVLIEELTVHKNSTEFIESEQRKAALAKLTDDEKVLLGLLSLEDAGKRRAFELV